MCSKRKKINWKLPESSFSCCFRIQCLAQPSFFFVNIFPNPKQKIHVPGYMQKFIPQSAKLCISFNNLNALCQQTSWLTHVANDHDVFDLLSCNAILDHFQTSSFYSTVVIRAWFFASNKIKLPKNVTFSPTQTRCSSPMKTMQEFKYLAFFNIFLKNRDRKKKKLFWT